MKINKIIISTYKKNGTYFSVGISSLNNKIVKISLPNKDEEQAIAEISKQYPDFKISDKYLKLAKTISQTYDGKKVNMGLEMLDLQVNKSDESPVKTMFMRDVLLQTYKIPYGKVRTYKFIAEKLGTHAYRAVGTALSKNPFPMIIPCHRVVKSDLTIGQYAGGSKMKKELLKKEGVPINGNKIVRG